MHNFVDAMLTDKYQVSMGYAYWECGKHKDNAVFDLFIRNCPFKGEFAIFAGLEECLHYIENFKITPEMIEVLRKDNPNCQEGFWKYLSSVTAKDVTLRAIPEGSIIFPRTPLIEIEGPLAIVQLMETTLLNLINYATLVATNAARLRLVAGFDVSLLEFGLRRAQGPNGGVSASKYCYLGGFDATSNYKAHELYGIPCKGTHAHSFVTAFTSLDDIRQDKFSESTIKARDILCRMFKLESTNDGELAAFIAYARAYPDGFLALVDTYDTLNSGVINFMAVAIALNEIGHKAIGMRLDSGDLAYLSKEVRKMLLHLSGKSVEYFRKSINLSKCTIVASNDINEEVLEALDKQGHQINSFGIGTHAVTCQAQPALGGVFKLVMINGKPVIKLSESIIKVTIPGRKQVFRLYNSNDNAVADIMLDYDEKAPQPEQKVICLDPFNQNKRVHIIPSQVGLLLQTYWQGQLTEKGRNLPSLTHIHDFVLSQLKTFQPEHLRSSNPTPYTIGLSQVLHEQMQTLWHNAQTVKVIR
jgi:nicotinate phosphoribosyltransferase